MRLLDRYLLRELLIPLGYILGGFLIFWIAFDLVTDLGKYQEKRLVFMEVVRLYLVKLPEILVLILPIVLLLALLYALTNHARHHELTAIRAAGVSLARICFPYLGVGLFLSLASFGMNEYWVPDSANREEEIMHQRSVDPEGVDPKFKGFNNARDGHNWNFAVWNPRTRVMTAPVVVWKSTGLKLAAGRAEHVNGVWNFYDAEEWDSKNNPLFQTNVLTIPELSETPEQINREMRFVRYSDSAKDHGVQSSEIPIAEILDYLNLHPNDLPASERARLLTQLHGRLAEPWTCVVVVLIAIPFGAASGRRNLFVGVASSIVICFVYFVLLKLGLAAGAGGYLPPWLAAWLPNLAFSVAAVWLMLRAR